MKKALVLTSALFLWAALALVRILPESHHLVRSHLSKVVVGATWDPRGYDLVDQIVKKRESDSFKERLKKGVSAGFRWPGLASAQVSWTWLELLEGLHNPSSYEGDFSWMFSKLNTVMHESPDQERRFVTTLAPFFFVIGHDHVGANILMDEMIRRVPESYNTWFWSGFHAVDNLYIRPLAGDLFEHAARMPEAPSYLAALVLRLKLGQDFLSLDEKREVIEKSVDPSLIEKIRIARPEWFER